MRCFLSLHEHSLPAPLSPPLLHLPERKAARAVHESRSYEVQLPIDPVFVCPTVTAMLLCWRRYTYYRPTWGWNAGLARNEMGVGRMLGYVCIVRGDGRIGDGRRRVEETINDSDQNGFEKVLFGRTFGWTVAKAR